MMVIGPSGREVGRVRVCSGGRGIGRGDGGHFSGGKEFPGVLNRVVGRFLIAELAKGDGGSRLNTYL